VLCGIQYWRDNSLSYEMLFKSFINWTANSYRFIWPHECNKGCFACYEKKLLGLIIEIMVDITLRKFYEGKEPPK
jgi:hypothetical protein